MSSGFCRRRGQVKMNNNNHRLLRGVYVVGKLYIFFLYHMVNIDASIIYYERRQKMHQQFLFA